MVYTSLTASVVDGGAFHGDGRLGGRSAERVGRKVVSRPHLLVRPAGPALWRADRELSGMVFRRCDRDRDFSNARFASKPRRAKAVWRDRKSSVARVAWACA